MDTAVIQKSLERYPAYKDSGVEWLGEIPEHWELTRLGTHFIERKEKVSDKDYPPLSVTKQGILPQLENAAKTNDGDNRKLVRKGDFVINSRSDRKGSSGIAYEDGSVSLINIVMRPISIDSQYCNYLLKSTAFVEENYRIGHGIVADLWTTRYDEMKNIKVTFPPLSEQIAIARFLDEKTAKIDRAIAQKERMIGLLKERKQILIQNAVTKGLDADGTLRQKPRCSPAEGLPAGWKDSGVEWIGEIPEHWEVKKFKYAIKLRHGHQFRDKDFTEDGIKVVKITQLNKDGYLDLSRADTISENRLKEFEHILIKDNDILMCLTGGTIGKIIRVSNAIEPLLQNYRVGHFSPLDVNQVNSDYLFYLLSSNQILDQIMLDMSETGQPNIGMEDMNKMIICLAPSSEQLAISEYIKLVSQKTAEALVYKEEEIEKLKEYKATLIDSVVTGKVRVG